MPPRTAIALFAAFLAACATTAPYYPTGYRGEPTPAVSLGTFQGPPGGPESTYVCEDFTSIVVRPHEGAAVATLNSGVSWRLAQQPFVGGQRYGDASFEFRSHGATGVWLIAQKPARPCRLTAGTGR